MERGVYFMGNAFIFIVPSQPFFSMVCRDEVSKGVARDWER
jgi:hypothetical protein